MRFLPVAQRELLAAGRRNSTWTWRCLYFLCALLACGWAYFEASRRSVSGQGESVFGALVVFLIFYGGLAGVHATSDTFGWEKREGTLGLLFLTDLSGWDVVAGKGVARAVNVFYGLLSMLPLLAVPLLLGGVTGGQVARSAFMLVVIALQSLAIGLWVSSRSINERRSMVVTLGLVLLTLSGPIITAVLADEAYGWSDRSAGFLGAASPVFGLIHVQALASVGGPQWHPQTWLISAGCSLVWTVLALVSASRHLPRSWSAELLAHHLARRSERRSWRSVLGAPVRVWNAMAQKVAAVRSRADLFGRTFFGARMRPLLDVHPYVWLCNRTADKRLLALSATVLIFAVALYHTARHGQVLGGPSLLYGFAVVLSWLLRFWMLAEPVMRLCEDRKSGALELVLVTPQQGPEIVRGIQRAMRRQFGWAVAIYVGVALTVWWSGAGYWHMRAMLLTSATALVVDFFALQWIGPWLGLTARSVTAGLMTGIALLAGPGLLWWAIIEGSSGMNSGLLRQAQRWAGEHWRWYFAAGWLATTLGWIGVAWFYRRFLWSRSVVWRWGFWALVSLPALVSLAGGYKVLTVLGWVPTNTFLLEWTHWLLMAVILWCWAKPALDLRFHELATAPHRPAT